MKDRMHVARVDVESDSGREIAQKYRINGVPAFVVLDAKGNVLYRKVGGRPDGAEIERRLMALR